MYGLLADFVVVLHFGFILLVIFGGFLALRWHRFVLLHLPAVIWALFLELRPGTVCPLTPLELSLRYHAGQTPYEGGFIDHYLGPIIYPDVTTLGQLLIGLVLLLYTVAIYFCIYRKWRSTRS